MDSSEIPTNWSWCDFDTVASDVTRLAPRIQRQEYLTSGSYPVIDQGQKLVGGYTEDAKLLFSGGLPVIIFGDHTCSFKFVDFPFVAGADGTKILAVHSQFVPQFVFYYFVSLGMRSEGYRRHFGLLREHQIPLPYPDDLARSLEIQRRIVARIEALFAELQECRKLHDEIVADTGQVMEAVLAEVFGRLDAATMNLENVCAIIGGGSLPSTGEEGSEGDDVLLLKVSELNKEENTPVITTSTQSISLQAALARRLRIVTPGSVIFPKRGGAIATNKKRLLAKHAILDPNLMAITPNDPNSLRPYFLLYWFETLDLATISSGSTVPQLNRGDLAPLQIPGLGAEVQDSLVAQLDQVRNELLDMRRIQNEDGQLLAQMEQAILAQAFRGEL